MPKHLTALKVFISGTAETDAERGALASIVADLSEILEKTRSVTLRTVAWPDSIRPGVGSDPQDVINQQVGFDYDVYVGILGVRFGSPTNRAGSGTEEEFNVALERFQADTSSVRVLFYFKRSSEDPFRINIDQLQRVLQFRESLGARGVLYRDFADTQNFAELARKHLHNLILDEWDTTRWRRAASASVPQSHELPNSTALILAGDTKSISIVLDNTSDDGEELGLIEAMEELENASSSLTIVLERISSHINVLTRNFEERTTEAIRLTDLMQSQSRPGSRANPELVKSVREVADQAAEDLEHFAIQMASDIKVFAHMTSALFEHVDRVRRIRAEFDVPSEQDDAEGNELKKLVENITTSQATTASFQSLVAGLPALTSKVRKARRRASLVLGELVAELQKSQSRGRQLLNTLTDETRD